MYIQSRPTSHCDIMFQNKTIKHLSASPGSASLLIAQGSHLYTGGLRWSSENDHIFFQKLSKMWSIVINSPDCYAYFTLWRGCNCFEEPSRQSEESWKFQVHYKYLHNGSEETIFIKSPAVVRGGWEARVSVLTWHLVSW